jgi:hypothetical protein
MEKIEIVIGCNDAQQRVYAPLLAEAAPVLGFRAILVR